ncbi:MAG: PQQ-dependent sugar dehydrogenase, partial [Bacteroidota bacterium]
MNQQFTFTNLFRVFVLTLFFFSLSQNVQAQGVPTGFADTEHVGGFSQAVGLTFDANGRMYVWEKRGIIWIVEDGVRLPNPLLDISEEVGNWRDFGMLGVALDPNFLSNGKIYLLYIVDRHHLMNFGTPSYNPNTNEYFDATIGRITRYTATASSNFTEVDYSSRKVLFGATADDGFPNLHQSHGTGHLVFGTDGTLLASLGDGASYNSVDVGSA